MQLVHGAAQLTAFEGGISGKHDVVNAQAGPGLNLNFYDDCLYEFGVLEGRELGFRVGESLFHKVLAYRGFGGAQEVGRNNGSAAQTQFFAQGVLARFADAFEVVLAELRKRFKAEFKVDHPTVACSDEELNVFKKFLLPKVADGARHLFGRKLYLVAHAESAQKGNHRGVEFVGTGDENSADFVVDSGGDFDGRSRGHLRPQRAGEDHEGGQDEGFDAHHAVSCSLVFPRRRSRPAYCSSASTRSSFEKSGQSTGKNTNSA